jgi:hypothetical protein
MGVFMFFVHFRKAAELFMKAATTAALWSSLKKKKNDGLLGLPEWE